tara:strand:+ start:1444 stop:1674 length:231 start_codon:yes stop_codon:yes gene_type:complete
MNSPKVIDIIDKQIKIGISGVHKYLEAKGEGIETELSSGEKKYNTKTMNAENILDMKKYFFSFRILNSDGFGKSLL